MMRKLLWLILGLVWASVGFAQQNLTPKPVDEAFRFSLQEINPHLLKAHWAIEKGYHLYRDRIHITLISPPSAKLKKLVFPEGIATEDEIFGKYHIYRDQLDIDLPIEDKNPSTVELLIAYQGCSEAGLCYPMQTKRIKANLMTKEVMINNELTHMSTIVLSSEQDKITTLLASHSLGIILLSFFGFGLLLSFTPCILPMIPILSGIIVGQKNIRLRRSFFLSFLYVFGMSITYALLGITAAYAGLRLQASFQSPWIISLFSGFFVLLSFSLFGFYELKLPSFIEARLSEFSYQQKSGTGLGAFVMGVLSSLIVSPCVSAPLVGALTYISQTKDMLLGGTSLFCLGLGMGLPLILVGIFGGKFLPKSGEWMFAVKKIFGVLLLAVAISMLERILPNAISLLLWASLLIISALFLGMFSTEKSNSGWKKIRKGFGFILFFYGIALVFGAASGRGTLFQPLAFLYENKQSTTQQESLFKIIKNKDDLESALQATSKEKKFALLDFSAQWCIACQKMDRTVFANPDVIAFQNKIVFLRADITANTAEDIALENAFNVIAPPTILFFDRNGKEIPQSRLVGEISEDGFISHVQLLLANF